MRLSLPLYAFVLVFAGCASSSHIITGTTRPELAVSQVVLYTTPPAHFEEIALLSVNARGWTDQREVNNAIKALKEQAAELGANGVLLGAIGTATSGTAGMVNPQSGAFWAANVVSTTMQARAIYVTN